MTQKRTTKYVVAVKDYLAEVGHASNSEILEDLRQIYKDLSATTIHRITTRLLERGEIALAPVANDNSMRFDANINPHDHFKCTECGLLRDANIKNQIQPILEDSIGGGCSISGRLTIAGLCNKCAHKGDNYA